jgi:hypothetical protein
MIPHVPRFRGKDRRAFSRYPVNTPFVYRAPGSGWKTGRTVDMSARGLLVDIPEPVVPGYTLDLAIDWPGLYHGKPAVRLMLAGSVVRIDPRGVALRILHHEFREIREHSHRRRSVANLAVA